MAQVQPWLSGEKPLLGDRIQLTTVAGTMVFAELAKADAANAAARTLALEGADAALKEKADGIPQYGQGWTDDMFMASAILARTAVDAGTRARSRSRRAAADRLRRPPPAARRHLQPRDRRPRRVGPRQRVRRLRPDGDADRDARGPSVTRGAARDLHAGR